ncbi:hypothetical protein [Anaeromyxobacter dehalogenans]|uniref:Collagen triple helix repeat protein n=1 Tax=Anaeromyxobacter dehalogenans (strain 2CP-C) TaxID=290397 RepID=Q2IIF6_ANADE|nr:hypothetical protein [Anaeromyxobacter dehalogenans]ABC81433.1 hypothetical protein Adeh_1660 [Anaeromyxobacter dehalogenans 2CP-C]
MRPSAASPVRAAPIAMLLAACAGSKLPMTAAGLAETGSPEALVAYLGQPGADGQVCARGGAVPEDVRRSRRTPGALVAALRAGKVPGPIWADCAESLLPAMPGERASDLVDRILGAEADLVEAPEVEHDPALQAQLEALHRVALERAPGPAGSRQVRAAVLAELRPRLAGDRLGPVARPRAEALAATLEAEQGEWEGRRVDAGRIAALTASRDEAALRLLARRLPDPDARAEAERGLVRVRIAASPFPEVKARAASVEVAVLRDGAYRISPQDHRPLRAALAPDRIPAATILARQSPPDGTATLLALGDGGRPGVLPPVHLAAALTVEVAGLSRPIRPCAPGRPLDPTPCLDPAALSVDSPYAALRGPDLVVRERADLPALAALARSGSRLEVPVRAGGALAGNVSWPVRFERPGRWVFEGSKPGAPGPDLAIALERVDADRLVVAATFPGGRRLAVLERADAPAFRIVTRGASGWSGRDGSRGRDGSTGTPGVDASCLSGSDGTAGGPGGPGEDGEAGGPGQPGGRGGAVNVAVRAPAALLADTLALAGGIVVSEGGRGGSGGRGGMGGHGGDGGAGGRRASLCLKDGRSVQLSGGFDGPMGPNGAAGPDGPSGSDGPAGLVRIEPAAAASLD